MQEALVPIVLFTGMFAMIFGIRYIRGRENMAMIEKGLNPRNKDLRPRPFINLKWGLLLIGAGTGLLLAYIIDNTVMPHDKRLGTHTSITIGGRHTRADKVVVINDTGHLAKDTSLAAQNTLTKNNDNSNDDDDNDNDDVRSMTEIKGAVAENPGLYFALIAIGGGLGLFFSYRIEKKEWQDKKQDA